MSTEFKTCSTIQKYLYSKTGKRVSVVKNGERNIVFNYVVNGELVTLTCNRYYVNVYEHELAGIIEQINGIIPVYQKYDLVGNLKDKWYKFCIIDFLPNNNLKCITISEDRAGNHVLHDMDPVELEPQYCYSITRTPEFNNVINDIQVQYR